MAIMRCGRILTEGGEEKLRLVIDLVSLCYLRFLLLDALVQNDQSDFADCSTIWTIKLFFSPVAGLGDPGACEAVAAVVDAGSASPTIDEIAARNSGSRFDGISTRTLSRPWSGRPFGAEPSKP